MTGKPSLWTRVRNFFSPPRESYDTRVARLGDTAAPDAPVYEATDGRRHGGSMQIGH